MTRLKLPRCSRRPLAGVLLVGVVCFVISPTITDEETVNLFGGLLQIGGIIVIALQARSAIGHHYGWPPFLSRLNGWMRKVFRRTQTVTSGAHLSWGRGKLHAAGIRARKDEAGMDDTERLDWHSTWLAEIDQEIDRLRTEAGRIDREAQERDEVLRKDFLAQLERHRQEMMAGVWGEEDIARCWWIGPSVFMLGTACTTWPSWFAGLL